MSRKPINEEIYSLGSHLRKGMDSLVVLEPGRLKVPFGGGGNRTQRKQSWMTVTCVPEQPEGGSVEPVGLAFHEVVLDVPKQKPEPSIARNSEIELEVPGWSLAVGYSIFGLCLALCNLFAPQLTGRVCTSVSPIPCLCLLLQFLACQDHICCELGRGVCLVSGAGLVLSALLLPSICAFWSPGLAIPFVLVLSASVFNCLRRRDVLSWICLAGVCLALLFAAPLPFPRVLDPVWGVTVAVFFACVLCFLAGLGVGRVGLRVKSIL
jgi:hypothetical protein